MFYAVIGLSLLSIHIVITMIVGSQNLYDCIGEIELDEEVEIFLNQSKKSYWD